MEAAAAAADRQFLYRTEHAEALQRIFGRQFAAVVGNPPYIVCRDPALNQQYRDRYQSCYRQYSLGVPFTEKFFDLALRADNLGRPAGFVGMITANSFMKREFGKKLIEQLMPTWDITHVVDTSGAYIPGHGTPTVILFGRQRAPVASTIRTVMWIRGEPSTPADPAKGLVWSAIVAQIDEPGSESEFVSVAETARSRFSTHPWSIGGGGAAELKDRMAKFSIRTLGELPGHIGYSGQTNADDVMTGNLKQGPQRFGVEPELTVPLVVGDAVRDWGLRIFEWAFLPYREGELVVIDDFPGWRKRLWPFRESLWARATFSRATYKVEGRPWYEWHLIRLGRLGTPGLVFSNIATHNHFVLDRPGSLLNPHAPAIKLDEANVTDHLILALGGIGAGNIVAIGLNRGFHSGGQRGHIGFIFGLFLL